MQQWTTNESQSHSSTRMNVGNITISLVGNIEWKKQVPDNYIEPDTLFIRFKTKAKLSNILHRWIYIYIFKATIGNKTKEWISMVDKNGRSGVKVPGEGDKEGAMVTVFHEWQILINQTLCPRILKLLLLTIIVFVWVRNWANHHLCSILLNLHKNHMRWELLLFPLHT